MGLGSESELLRIRSGVGLRYVMSLGLSMCTWRGVMKKMENWDGKVSGDMCW